MSGNFSVLEPLTNRMPTGSATQGAPLYGPEIFVTRRTSSQIPMQLFESAMNVFNESLEESIEEGLPTPSETACERAKEEIQKLATHLRHPTAKTIISAVCTPRGDIEIVGHFAGILGRITVRIDRDGTCAQVSVV